MKATAATKCAPFMTSARRGRQRGKGAGGAEGSEERGQADAFGSGASHIGREPALGNERLDHGADEVPQNKRPSRLPEETGRCFGRLAE